MVAKIFRVCARSPEDHIYSKAQVDEHSSGVTVATFRDRPLPPTFARGVFAGN